MPPKKTTEIDLRALKKDLAYKWKPQTCNEYSARMVGYLDARDVQDRLDEVCGPENWQCEFYELKGRIFCKIGVSLGGQWVWKSDCGSESKSDPEKGEASDAFKRAAVHWGIGRFLYALPEVNLKTTQWDKNKKWYPAATKGGQILWDKKELNAICNAKVKAIEAGGAVDEPAPPQESAPPESPPAQKKTEPSEVDNETILLAKKAQAGLMMLVNNDESLLPAKLEELSGFMGKDKQTGEEKYVEGKRSLRELAKRPKWLKTTWGRIKAEMEKQGADLPEDMQNDGSPQKEIDRQADEWAWNPEDLSPEVRG